MTRPTIDDVHDAPWDRGEWHGEFVSADGTPVGDFTRDDVGALLAFGKSGGVWDGSSAGVARINDGRIVAWESTYGPTGSGFHADAYGGDADIIFARTVAVAVSHISESSREFLEWLPSSAEARS